MLSADYFLTFFLLFVASALFLWLAGAAAFDRQLGAGSIYRAPWLGYALLVGFPLILYSLFWFITAPDPRYFGSAMWIFAICPALTFVAGGSRTGLASALACLGSATIPIFFIAWEFRWAWTYAEERLPIFTVMETRPFKNSHGVVIWLNPDGIQTYDSPLPSSWKPRPFLALLNPEKGIAGGFKYARPQKTSD